MSKKIGGAILGGTNVKAIAVTNGARVLAEISLPTGGAESTKWKAAVRRAKGEIETRTGHPPLWIGVVAPGLPARDQRSIAFLPGRLPGLEGLDWQDFFAFERAVPVLNDAQAALLGEVWLGAARDSHNTVLLTLGTGVGGAAQVDGRLLRGHLGRAGHLGHISLNPAGARDIVRTPGSLEDAIGDCTVALRTGGRFSSTAELVAACVRGDSYVAERFGADCVALNRPAVAFGLRNEHWKPFTFPSGLRTEVPGAFSPEFVAGRGLVLKRGGTAIAQMPERSFYFDRLEKYPGALHPDLAQWRAPRLDAVSLEHFHREADALSRNTDKAVIAAMGPPYALLVSSAR